MRRVFLPALTAVTAMAALSMLSCSAEPKGQIILAIKTDMSLPKDIDRIRLVVTYADTNGVAFASNYNAVGDDPVRLPATLSLVAPEEGNRPIRVKVLAFRGGDDEDVRVVRDSVTTVPKDRVVTLPVPIEFLCDGSAKIKTDAAGKPVKDEDGQVIFEGSCGDGLTCKAGKCVTEEVAPEDLPDFDEGEIFGGGTGSGDGTCFDTAECFKGAAPLELDMAAFEKDGANCRAIAPAGAFNVGVETQGSGMCNDKGCYVALDADSESGWKQEGPSIVLPPAICQKFKTGEVVRIVSKSVDQAPCAQKRSSVPTCGPWSASGADYVKPSDSNAVSIVISGQINPNALAIDTNTGSIYWTTQGNLDEKDILGSVKGAPILGGTPTSLAEMQLDSVTQLPAVPQGLLISEGSANVYWTVATGSSSGSIAFAPLGDLAAPVVTTAVGGLLQPAGIAMTGEQMYFTELGGDRVSMAPINPDGTLGMATALSNPGGAAPWSIVAAPEAVCFGYQGTPNNADGVVACSVNGTTVPVATNLKTPRSLVFQKDANNGNLILYFAELDAQGSIQKVTFDGTSFSQPDILVPSVSRPSALSLDAKAAVPALYYTTLGDGNGTVMALRLSNLETLPIATNRYNPNAVAFDAESVYWVEGGTPNKKEGAILKAPKPNPQ